MAQTLPSFGYLFMILVSFARRGIVTSIWQCRYVDAFLLVVRRRPLKWRLGCPVHVLLGRFQEAAGNHSEKGCRCVDSPDKSVGLGLCILDCIDTGTNDLWGHARNCEETCKILAQIVANELPNRLWWGS